MSRAEYMREYRAKRKVTAYHEGVEEAVADMSVIASARIAELEAEVARLKRELAKRAVYVPDFDTGESSFRQFRPAPKPGRK